MTSTLPEPILNHPELRTADGAVLIARLVADLTAENELSAQRELSWLCCQPGTARWVVLVAADLEFVDVRGLAVLLAACECSAAMGRRVLVVSPPRSLTRMVEVLDLAAVLPLVATTREAAALIAVEDTCAG